MITAAEEMCYARTTRISNWDFFAPILLQREMLKVAQNVLRPVETFDRGNNKLLRKTPCTGSCACVNSVPLGSKTANRYFHVMFGQSHRVGIWASSGSEPKEKLAIFLCAGPGGGGNVF